MLISLGSAFQSKAATRSHVLNKIYLDSIFHAVTDVELIER